MSQNNVRIIFMAAIGFVLWGGYNVARASYIAFSWNRTEGTVVDFERNTWSCGKGVGECYALVVSYPAGNGTYTITSNRKFSHAKPLHMLKDQITVYYSPLNPGEAILGGSYGPFTYGIWLFVIGVVVLLVFWIINKRKMEHQGINRVSTEKT